MPSNSTATYTTRLTPEDISRISFRPRRQVVIRPPRVDFGLSGLSAMVEDMTAAIADNPFGRHEPEVVEIPLMAVEFVGEIVNRLGRYPRDEELGFLRSLALYNAPQSMPTGPSIHVNPERWSKCKRCSRDVPRRSLTRMGMNQGSWCVECIVAHAVHPGGRDAKFVTQEYFAINYLRCDDCKYPMRKDHGHHDFKVDANTKLKLCGECYNFRRTIGYANPILRYNADVSQHVKMLTNPAPDGMNIGVEIELEVRQGNKAECALTMREVLGKDDACIKHDGSLANGFEIVTAANSLPYTREVLNRLFEHRDTFSKWRIAAWEMATCGLHVHISRDVLTDLQIGKMVAFVHAPGNRTLIRKLAGRESNKRYGGYDPYKDHREIILIPFGANHSSDARYTAVNIANYHTVELRIFKGTLNPLRVMADIEFTHALAAFAAPCNTTIADSVKGSVFLSWLNGRAKEYPNLVQFLQKTDFLQE